MSALLLGFMVAFERRPDLVVAAILVGFFAIFHGYAHGVVLPAGQSGILYSIGFVISTGTLHACGITVGLIHRWKWGRLVLRGVGGVIALAGASFTWIAITG